MRWSAGVLVLCAFLVACGGGAGNSSKPPVNIPPTTPSISSLSQTSGILGTPVAIIGGGFGSAQGSSSVAFNGTTASVVSWSDANIVAEVPAGATTGDVVVTANSLVSNGVAFTIGAPPASAKVYVFKPPAAGSSSLATIYANADGASVQIPWSADNADPTLGGWETTSPTDSSASAGYSWTNFDNVINTQLGFGAASVIPILIPVQDEGATANTFSPNYISTA